MNLREALTFVRSASPAEIEALEVQDKAKAKEDARIIKQAAEDAAKFREAIVERVQKLVEDHYEAERAAIQLAAEALAREQLEVEFGHLDPQVAAFRGLPPSRLNAKRIEAARTKVGATTALGWDKAGRSGAAVQSAMAREAASSFDRADLVLSKSEAEQMAADRREQIEARRQRRIAQRKREAGIQVPDAA